MCIYRYCPKLAAGDGDGRLEQRSGTPRTAAEEALWNRVEELIKDNRHVYQRETGGLNEKFTR
jgi:hypothetical protein